MPETDDDLRALGAALRYLRVGQGVTQEQLALAADLHRSYVGQVEMGRRNPSYTSLLRIAAGLDVPLSQWIGAAERADDLTQPPDLPRRARPPKPRR